MAGAAFAAVRAGGKLPLSAPLSPKTLPVLPDPLSDNFVFFNREHETNELQSFIKSDPTGVLVLLGPKSSGKTALVQHLLVDHPALVGLDRPAFYIDARRDPITSASDLKRSILDCSPRFWDVVEGVADKISAATGTVASASLSSSIGGVRLEMGGSNNTLPSMRQILAWVEERLLADHTPGKPAPVLVIDEANDLMEWRENLAELNLFLKFCVRVGLFVRPEPAILCLAREREPPSTSD